MIQVFVNETSIDKQYNTIDEFQNAVVVFNNVFNRFVDIVGKQNLRFAIYFEEYCLENCYPMENSCLKKSLNAIRGKLIRETFMKLFYRKLHLVNWRETQAHNPNDIFFCKESNTNVSDTSIAELTERKLANAELVSFLYNFLGSIFDNHAMIRVTKNNHPDEISLDCIKSENCLDNWLEPKFCIKKHAYNPTSNISPRDEQTVLSDSKKFTQTNYIDPNGSRHIYEERETLYLWYVDNFHFGGSAHPCSIGHLRPAA
ncbi:MAG: hypothetical protein HQK89_01315 [Nitrospirae bacterium]|nr:hypothetical protein [Nitrospirota bacterium]